MVSLAFIRSGSKWMAIALTAALGATLYASKGVDAFWRFKSGLIVYVASGYFGIAQGEVDTTPDIGGYPMTWPTGGSMLPHSQVFAQLGWWPPVYHLSGVYWGTGVAIWVPMMAAAAMSALLWRSDFLIRRKGVRMRAGLCPSCGYDRRGLTAGAKCPECGAAGSGAV